MFLAHGRPRAPGWCSGGSLLPNDPLAVTIALLAPASAPAQAQSGSWDKDANGNWSASGNWLSGTVPAGGGTATFGGAFSSGFLTANRTVTLDIPVTLGGLTFDNILNGFGYTISGTQPLTFTSGATITAGSFGANAVSTPIALDGQVTISGSGLGLLTLGATGGADLTNGTGTGSLLINQTPSIFTFGATSAVYGVTALNGTNNTYSGGVTLQSGGLRLLSNSALGTER